MCQWNMGDHNQEENTWNHSQPQVLKSEDESYYKMIGLLSKLELETWEQSASPEFMMVYGRRVKLAT